MEKKKSEIYGVVYFVGPRDSGPVKIGFTANDVTLRLKQLQTGSHEKLVVLGKVPGGPFVEQAIHNFLNPHLVHGEWFDREAALVLLSRLENRSQHHTGDFVERLMFATDRLTQNDEEIEPLEVKVARDIIWDIAQELQTVNTQNSLPLRAWILAQKGRDNPAGDLAEDVSRDPEFPAIGTLADYLSYVMSKTTNPTITRVIIKAWIECDIAADELKYS